MRHKVMLAIPHNGTLVYGAARGLLRASDKHQVTVVDNGGSALAACFNALFAQALMAAEKGAITHLAFLHADIAPADLWVDTLLDEMDALKADLVSVVAPIKDNRGLTSTAIGLPGVSWVPWRRLTMREVMTLPETFDADSAGYPGKVLLHNTGCWVADLRNPLFHATEVVEGVERAKMYFTLNDCIVRQDGEWTYLMEPEDWFWSRKLHEAGARTFVTRKLNLAHIGHYGFSNEYAWGTWQCDETTRINWVNDEPAGRPTIGEHGEWLVDFSEGEMVDKPLAAALVAETSGSVLDAGCGRGHYVKAFAEAGRDVLGLDGNPSVVNIPHCRKADLTWPETGNTRFDWVLSLEVGEHLPAEYEDVFVDNLVSAARVGIILSWAQPGQDGVGHVNCKPLEDVVKMLFDRGCRYDMALTDRLRSTATLPHFKRNLIVFRKGTKCDARTNGLEGPDHKGPVPG